MATRKRWLWGIAAAQIMVMAMVLGAAACPAAARAPIKVGVLHSLTGSVAIAERPINDTTLMAIREINESGGLLGRKVEPIVVDGKSDWPTFGVEAERLIANEKVKSVFGGYTSASRRTIVPIFERHKNLLLYPTFYEGIESSPHVVYTGGAPNQFIFPAVKWLLENRGKKFFLVGSDYIFPRSANEMVKDQLRYLGGTVVGEDYVALGEMRVDSVIQRIVRAKPDVILSIVVGDTNIPFYRGLRAAGITPKKVPTMALAIDEQVLTSLDPRELAGDLVSLNYFQSIDSRENTAFVRRFKEWYGKDQVVSDVMEAAYVSVHLWAQAVRKAGKAEPVPVLSAMRGLRFDAPEGAVYIDEKNLHLWKRARVAKIKANGQLEIMWTSEVVIHPVPYPVYRTRREWEELVQQLYVSWGGGWARP